MKVECFIHNRYSGRLFYVDLKLSMMLPGQDRSEGPAKGVSSIHPDNSFVSNHLHVDHFSIFALICIAVLSLSSTWSDEVVFLLRSCLPSPSPFHTCHMPDATWGPHRGVVRKFHKMCFECGSFDQLTSTSIAFK